MSHYQSRTKIRLLNLHHHSNYVNDYIAARPLYSVQPGINIDFHDFKARLGAMARKGLVQIKKTRTAGGGELNLYRCTDIGAELCWKWQEQKDIKQNELGQWVYTWWYGQ